MMRVENTIRRGHLLLLLGLRAGTLKWACRVIRKLWRRRKWSSDMVVSVLFTPSPPHVVLARAMIHVTRRWRWGARIRLTVRRGVWRGLL